MGPIVKKVEGLSAMSCGKTAKLIEMLFEVWTWMDPRKDVLDGSAHWRHLANAIERLCGRGAAFLSNYFDHFLLLLWTTNHTWCGLCVVVD